MFDEAIIFLRGGMNMSLEVYDVELSICQQESLTMTFYICNSARLLVWLLQLR